MHVSDVPDTGVVSGCPDDVVRILDGPYTIHGYTIHRMELRLYMKSGAGLPHWIITAYIEMDGHTIETIYEEGRGRASLQDTANFLASSLGPSGAILRARISLEAALEDSGKV